MKTYGLIFTTGNPASAPAVSLAPTLTTFMTLGGTTMAPPGITKPISTLGLYTFEWTPTLPIFFVADGGTLITDDTQRYLKGILDPTNLINETGNTLIAFGNTLFALGTTNVALGTTNIALGTTNVAIGTTNVALGTTNVALGTTNVAIGTTGIANSTAYGSSNIALGNSIISQGLTALGYGVSTHALATTILAQGVSLTVNIDASSTLLQLINLKLGETTSAFGSTLTNPDTIYGYLRRQQEFLEGSQVFNKASGQWEISSRGGTLLSVKTLTNTSSQVTRS